MHWLIYVHLLRKDLFSYNNLTEQKKRAQLGSRALQRSRKVFGKASSLLEECSWVSSSPSFCKVILRISHLYAKSVLVTDDRVRGNDASGKHDSRWQKHAWCHRTNCCVVVRRRLLFCKQCNAVYKLYTLPTTNMHRKPCTLFLCCQTSFLHAAAADTMLFSGFMQCRFGACFHFFWESVWQTYFEEEKEEEAIVKTSSLCPSWHS